MGHVEHHAVQRHNRMICFDDGADRFQMRAAGIAIRDGRVLVQNIKDNPVRFLPGGRIDQNESSVDTVVREMEEEFERAVEVGRLLFVIESFFPEKAQLFHEVGFYFEMIVPDAFPYHETDICHRCFEGPIEMEYRWVPATEASLTAASFFPMPLRSQLASLPGTTVHILDHSPE
jgi:8-oxo-dGTP pyrophosphatase MutT (NUDIX family)